MSAVSQAKKLKITVTNIRSILSKKTKRLANLKKINSRDQNKLFSQQKRKSAEKKVESPLKGISKKIASPFKKVSNKLNIGKVIGAVGLIAGGIAINAVFASIDDIKKGAEDLKKKIDSWMGNNEGNMDKVERGLDQIPTGKLKQMSDKFFDKSTKLNEDVKKLENKNSTYSYPDPENPGKMITTTGKKYFKMLNVDKKSSSSDISGTNDMIQPIKNDIIQPIKEDNNLSSLLNNDSNKTNVVLARQVVEVPV
tara:strand:- start:7 stop:765 length:759 start_codon:yes stop_codon:yes gene_type:complete